MLVPAAGIADHIHRPKLIGNLDLHSAERHTRYVRIAAPIVGIAIIVVVACALYFHNKWERDNRVRLRSLMADAAMLVQDKQYEKAESKYDELFGLLSDHVLGDEYLRAEIDSARTDAAENNKKVGKIVAARTAADRKKESSQPEEIVGETSISDPVGPPRIGETRRIKVKCFAAVSDETLDRAFEIVQANDDIALSRMLALGQLENLEPGTAVPIEDITVFGKAQVRVQGGATLVWIFSEWVH
jgi:hypothetical protein